MKQGWYICAPLQFSLEVVIRCSLLEESENAEKAPSLIIGVKLQDRNNSSINTLKLK